MANRILVPVDGSPPSKAGLTHALSSHPDASIVVLHVMTPYESTGDEDPPLPDELSENWHEQARERAETILAEATDLAAEYGNSVDTELEVGEAWRAVVDYAEANDVDHIVMGSHGRDDRRGVGLGSVAEAVVRRSSGTVTVVR
jgi:nucleotide-binding universal stress UspA family protein